MPERVILGRVELELDPGGAKQIVKQIRQIQNLARKGPNWKMGEIRKTIRPHVPRVGDTKERWDAIKEASSQLAHKQITAKALRPDFLRARGIVPPSGGGGGGGEGGSNSPQGGGKGNIFLRAAMRTNKKFGGFGKMILAVAKRFLVIGGIISAIVVKWRIITGVAKMILSSMRQRAMYSHISAQQLGKERITDLQRNLFRGSTEGKAFAMLSNAMIRLKDAWAVFVNQTLRYLAPLLSALLDSLTALITVINALIQAQLMITEGILTVIRVGTPIGWAQQLIGDPIGKLIKEIRDIRKDAFEFMTRQQVHDHNMAGPMARLLLREAGSSATHMAGSTSVVGGKRTPGIFRSPFTRPAAAP